MFDPNSRYAALPSASLVVQSADGTPRTLVYKQRRLLPPQSGSAAIEHTVDEGDRLDRIAATYLSDGTLFWKLCDRNGCLHPRELTEEPGRKLIIRNPGE